MTLPPRSANAERAREIANRSGVCDCPEPLLGCDRINCDQCGERMIAAALDEAERRGAEKMREACDEMVRLRCVGHVERIMAADKEDRVDTTAAFCSVECAYIRDCIRALPLPEAGK